MFSRFGFGFTFKEDLTISTSNDYVSILKTGGEDFFISAAKMCEMFGLKFPARETLLRV